MSKRAAHTADPVQAVPLDARATPSQDRARGTFETVVSTAGELLAEVGFERLTTNLVCERAGITPPALYRYFPNKYAILGELGRRLMEAQDEAVFAWIQAGGLETQGLEASVEANQRLLRQVNEITRQSPGSIWILRALRAVPLLRDIRIASRDKVAAQIAARMQRVYPAVPEDELFRSARLTVEMTYAASEMVLEEGAEDEDRINADVCWMVALHYQRLAERFSNNN